MLPTDLKNYRSDDHEDAFAICTPGQALRILVCLILFAAIVEPLFR